MGVDASAIGGIGYEFPICTNFDFYLNLGFIKEEDEDKFNDYGIEDWEEFLQEIVGESVSFQSTYGYDESELYAFVTGDTIDEIYNNVDGFISGLKKIGLEVKRDEIKTIVISFFS